ncbi:MAG: tetratricopeptide repeat protein [Armatimonadetes bacterium]|nr:tetratricopeptide repeat protein [Armatimonadota bacterium]
MRRAIVTFIGLILAIMLGISAEAAGRPMVLVFETSAGTGISKQLASSSSRALRNYLRDSQRVEATIFDRESPAVLRAIMDKKLTADSVASFSSKEQRIEAARTLGFDYAAAADLSIIKKTDLLPPLKTKGPKTEVKINPEDEMSSLMQVKLWLADVDSRKSNWEAIGSSMIVGTGELDLGNSMQSAMSTSVLDIVRQAFAKLPRVKQTDPSATDNSSAIAASAPPPASQPTAADYSSQAETSLKDGNLALAIQQYSMAVSADPSNGPLRIKLAEAFARKGMFDQADDELTRALEAGADKAAIDAARARVEAMQTGTKPPPPSEAKTVDKGSQSVAVGPKPTGDAYSQAVAKLIEGDKLWNQGKPDDAAQAYSDAAKLYPLDWRSHERLAIVNASMSLFNEARKALEQLNVVQPEPSAEVAQNRYDMFRRAFDKSFEMLLKQYDDDSADFEKKIISRESYYTTVNGLALRLESMAKFLDALPVPSSKKPANLRRSLACGLAAQAASNSLDYLESNNKKAKANADVFMSQAKKEIQAASKLDDNKVVVSKEAPKEGTGTPDEGSESPEQPQPDESAPAEGQ